MLTGLLREKLQPYRSWITAVVALQVVATMAMLYLPALNADIIDKGVVTGDTGYIGRLGAWMLAVSAVQGICTVGAVYAGARSASALGRDLRAAVFDRVQRFSTREIGQIGTPSLITRSTNDIQQVQMLTLMGLTMMAAAPIMGVGAAIMAVHEDAPLSLLLVLVVPVLGLSVAAIVRRMRPLGRDMQDRVDGINRVLREQIAGVRVVRAFVRDGFERRRFAGANDDLYDVSMAMGRLMSMMFPLVILVINLSSVLVIWFGGLRIDSGGMQIGALTAFLSYLMQMLMAVMMATFMFVMLPRAEASAERIVEVLDTESSLEPPVAPRLPAGRSRGRLELRDVEFRYPGADEPVLHGVSLVAEPGQVTAVIGSTGAGKTTMINLIPRLADVTAGEVLLDGVDVRELDPAVLASSIGLVPQRPYLFSGTVGSNVRYGDPAATDEQVWEALDVAQARDFVSAMPEGLETPIAQGGTNVSGGQRQRLAIARALVRRPALYLFDDSFSALDYATDAALRQALMRRTSDAAVLIVAQRVNTIRHADRIVVLDEGRVVGTGRHEELMETCETYREIVLSQLTEQEAA
ncbi:ABC transporter ATP-binding protein [Spongisporangium articulatum]|uniref:ABC transporter ATP-binding protein n=1 Tax=Spongisporangium articulatum TaxID=3362603 RepID=A0ABW8AMD0_9ACTN